MYSFSNKRDRTQLAVGVSKPYTYILGGENITYGIIEIHFLYNLTANAEKFLQSVQNQVAELGVKIQYCVSQEGADEAR